MVKVTKPKPKLSDAHPELAKQWDYEKNGDLRPGALTAGSAKKVWWKCNKGHSYQSKVSQRVIKGNGCPYCSGRRVLQGYNDLATTHPELVNEWDYEKNGDLTPVGVTAGSNKKVWWKCSEGHSWEATLASRAKRGSGCPYCKNKKVLPGYNDLATTHPELAKQWDYEKNGDLTPRMVTVGSGKMVWWQCSEGHSWKASVDARHAGRKGCGVCSGNRVVVKYNDLATTHPETAGRWDYEKNGDLTPSDVSKGSDTKVWWKCSKGHSHQATVSSRVVSGREGACPTCANRQILKGYNDLATTHPELLDEWHPTRNTVAPQEISSGTASKVWWRCSEGHEWQTAVYNRTKQLRTGCPYCFATRSVSKGEEALKDFVEGLGEEVLGSHRALSGIHELDIYLPQKDLAIEFNGLYWHSSAHKDTNYHLDKWQACKDQGIRLIYIWEDEWVARPEVVKSMIAHKLGKSPTSERVYARKTHVEPVGVDVAREFLEANHIQGFGGGSLRLGLVDEASELVAIGIFRKRPESEYELVRYATSKIVVGGLGKLLGHIKKNYPDIRSLVTFADHGVSDGGVYEKLGFVADGVLKPDYKYVVGMERVHKFNYRLARFKKDPDLLWQGGLTESQLADLNGLVRIYDAGKTRYRLVL